MSNINLSLDDIIAKTKASKPARGITKSFKNDQTVGRKVGGIKKGANGKGEAFIKTIPSGKWVHDKFTATDSIRTHGASPKDSFANSNKKMRMNISNLAATVTSTDLQELFCSYSIDSAVVHYGQNGKHLGTGEVVMEKRNAQKALIDLKGIAIDGSPLQLAIIDGETRGSSISTRVQMVRKVGGNNQKRSRNVHSQKIRSVKRLSGRTHLKGFNEKKSSKGNRGKIGKGATNSKSEKELNAEMDSYMKRTVMEQ